MDTLFVDHIVSRHAQEALGVGKGFHLLHFSDCAANGFFAENVLSRLQGHRGVHEVGFYIRENEYGIDVGIVQQLLGRAVARAGELFRAFAGPSCRTAPQPYKPCIRVGANSLRVENRHVPCPEESNTKLS